MANAAEVPDELVVRLDAGRARVQLQAGLVTRDVHALVADDDSAQLELRQTADHRARSMPTRSHDVTAAARSRDVVKSTHRVVTSPLWRGVVTS